MPTYEVPLLIRTLSKPELATVLKRTAQAIFQRGGFIRKIDNLGTQDLPCKVTSEGQTHWKASQFIIHADVPPHQLGSLTDEYLRDLDILRHAVYKKNVPEEVECTLHLDMLPPAYRPGVQKLLEIAKIRADKKARKKYKVGVENSPFQR